MKNKSHQANQDTHIGFSGGIKGWHPGTMILGLENVAQTLDSLSYLGSTDLSRVFTFSDFRGPNIPFVTWRQC